MDFNWNFCPENDPERKTGLDNGHVMGYKEREHSAQGDGLPAKGEAGRDARPAQRENAKLKHKKETAIMDTFEKIRALLENSWTSILLRSRWTVTLWAILRPTALTSWIW